MSICCHHPELLELQRPTFQYAHFGFYALIHVYCVKCVLMGLCDCVCEACGRGGVCLHLGQTIKSSVLFCSVLFFRCDTGDFPLKPAV